MYKKIEPQQIWVQSRRALLQEHHLYNTTAMPVTHSRTHTVCRTAQISKCHWTDGVSTLVSPTYLARPGQQQVGDGPNHQAEIQKHDFTLASTHSLFHRCNGLCNVWLWHLPGEHVTHLPFACGKNRKTHLFILAHVTGSHAWKSWCFVL